MSKLKLASMTIPFIGSIIASIGWGLLSTAKTKDDVKTYYNVTMAGIIIAVVSWVLILFSHMFTFGSH